MGRPTRHSLSRISLAFPERYPSPVDARGLSEARLRSFLAREHYTGSQKARGTNGQAPPRCSRIRRRAGAQHPPSARAEPGRGAQDAQRADQGLERRLATGVRDQPDRPIFLSLFKKPGSVICAAGLLTETGDCRARNHP
jgi:hypothetical protein